MVNKRGQFFLLAAVIISVVVLSLGVTTNRAVFSEEPKNFYDFSYEVEREVGATIDYSVYSGFNDTDNLDEFVDLISEDIKQRSPDSDFVFIYGDENEVSLRAYGLEEEEKKENKVCYGAACQGFSGGLGEWVNSSDYNVDEDEDEISVTLKGNTYKFPAFKSKQVVFLIQKNVGEESYADFTR